jgi:hypothetical protein
MHVMHAMHVTTAHIHWQQHLAPAASIGPAGQKGPYSAADSALSASGCALVPYSRPGRPRPPPSGPRADHLWPAAAGRRQPCHDVTARPSRCARSNSTSHMGDVCRWLQKCDALRRLRILDEGFLLTAVPTCRCRRRARRRHNSNSE